MCKPYRIHLISLLASLLFITPYAFAGTYSTGIQNKSNYYLVLSAADSGNSGYCSTYGKPATCSHVIPPNGKGQQWVNLDKANAWVTLSYNACSQVDSNGQCQGYFANVTLSLSHKTVDINQAAKDKGFKLTRPDSSAKPFVLTAKGISPPPAPDFPKPSQYQSIPYRGVNLSGAEFGSALSMNTIPIAKDALYFAKQGMNTFRIPIKWSYAQPKLGGDLDATYINYVHEVVAQLTKAGFNVILDLHAYMRFSPNQGAGAGKLVNPKDMQDIWGKLAAEFKDLATKYPKQVIFDLMNEPNTMSTAQALADEQAGLDAIRAAGLKNLVLFEGNQWTGLHSWLNFPGTDGKTNADVFTAANIHDPANNYAINVHQYFDSNFSGTQATCVDPATLKQKLNFDAFMQWVHQNKVKVFVTEFGATTAANCPTDVDTLLSLMQQNAYQPGQGGFFGWTAWSAGHAWAKSYLMNLTPDGNANGLIPDVFEHYLRQK